MSSLTPRCGCDGGHGGFVLGCPGGERPRRGSQMAAKVHPIQTEHPSRDTCRPRPREGSPGAFHPQRVEAARFPGGQTHPRGQGVPQGLECPLAGGSTALSPSDAPKTLGCGWRWTRARLGAIAMRQGLFGDAELASAEHMRPLRRGVQGPQGVFFGECPLVQVAPPPRCPHLQGVERLGLGLCMSERKRHPTPPTLNTLQPSPFSMAGKPLNFALWPHHRR